MSNDLLDSPIGLRNIRKPYFNFVEYAIMISNALFIIIGVGMCWNNVLEGGSLIFLINPPIFILLFGLTPIFYIRTWRKNSLEYDKTNNADIFKNQTSDLIFFLNIVLLIIWSFIIGLFVFVFGAIVSDIGEISPFFIAFMAVFLIPFVCLGPVQFFFIRTTRKIQQEILASL